jgi:general secretion pathway protein J
VKGFTLVEMLVALAALSLLAGAGIVLTQVAVDTRDSIEVRDQSHRELLRLRTIMKSDLGQAAPRRARDESGSRANAALVGRPQAGGDAFLQLVRRGWENVSGERRSSLQYVEYGLRNGAIERRHRRMVDGAPLEAPQVLVEGVRAVNVSYFQYDQWAEAYAGSASRPLPRAVAIEIEFDDATRLRQLFLLPEFAA